MASVAFDGMLQGSAAASGSHTDPKKLHEAAQQFEALLITEMLKSVRDSGDGGWMGSGDSAGDDSALDMAQSQFAQSLSQSGGLGLTQTIERSVARQDAAVSAHQKVNTAEAVSIAPAP